MTLISFSRSHRHFETQILIEKSLCAHFILNQWLKFYQTSTDTSLGKGKEVIRFWWLWPHFQGHYIIKTVKMSFVCTLSHESIEGIWPNKHSYIIGMGEWRDGRGIAGLMCEAVIFSVPPQCRVSAGLVILRRYTPVEFTIIKSRAMTLSRSLQCRAFSRSLIDEKSLSPLFPVGGRARGGGGSGYKWLVHNDMKESHIYSFRNPDRPISLITDLNNISCHEFNMMYVQNTCIVFQMH